MEPSPDRRDAEVIDLGRLRAVCCRVAAWYEELLAGGAPSIVTLDRVLAEIRALPAVGGELGQALRVLADPPPRLCDTELLEHLCRVRAASGVPAGQLQLPGFES